MPSPKHKMISLRYEDQEVRAFLEEDDTVWFVAADIGRALGYRDGSDLTRNTPQEEKTYCRADTPYGLMRHVAVSDRGLYQTALRAEKTFGPDLRRWLTHDALPQALRTWAPGVDFTHDRALRQVILLRLGRGLIPKPLLTQLAEEILDAALELGFH